MPARQPVFGGDAVHHAELANVFDGRRPLRHATYRRVYSAGTPSMTIWLYIPTPPMMLFWKPALFTPGMAARYP